MVASNDVSSSLVSLVTALTNGKKVLSYGSTTLRYLLSCVNLLSCLNEALPPLLVRHS